MRTRNWILLVVALTLMIAACGGTEETTTTAGPTTTAAPTTTAGALQTKEPGVLTIGSDIPYPPFEDFDASGKVIGFDADLMNEMARRLGLTPNWIDTDFDTIFTQLASGNFDVVASATTITPDRAQMVKFTKGYYNSNQAFTINTTVTPNIAGVADLKSGDAVAVQTGTTGAIWATANLASKGIVIREFTAAPDCFGALEAGQVVGTIVDVDPSLEAEATRPGLKVAEEILTGEQYGFGVNPANAALLSELDRVFQEMLDDGFYQTAYDKWITRPQGSVLYTP
jgi:polar amino acid transport system substrate-binding protein